MHDLRFTVTDKYDVLLIDPPWSYYGSQTKNAAVGKHYGTMTDEQIAAIPVREWLMPDSVVFLWATAPRMDTAIDIVRTWGLHYRGLSFVWVKTRKDGKPIGAQGIRPSITKPTSEYVIAASGKKRGRPLPIADEGVPQIVLEPRGPHSSKPVEVNRRIDRLYPGRTKAELFARRSYPGWDCYGDGAGALW